MLTTMVLRWLAVAFTYQGKGEAAREHFAQLLERSRSLADRRHEAWALTGLAYYDQTHGVPAGAAEQYRLAVAIFAEIGDARSEIFALNGLGTALQDLGAYDEARKCYRRTAEIGRQLERPFTTALAENNLGSLEYALGDPGRALEHFTEAFNLQKADGAQRAHIIPATNIAQAEAALGRYRQATDTLENLLADCETGGFEDLKHLVLWELARVKEDAGQPQQAEAIYRRLLDEIPPARHIPLMRALTGLAHLLRSQGRADASRELLDQWHEWRRGVTEPEYQAQYDLERGLALLTVGELDKAAVQLASADSIVQELGLSGLRLRTLAARARTWERQGHVTEAIQCLNTAAELWETDRRLPLDPEWREQRGVWARQISTDLAWHRWHDTREPPASRAASTFATVQTFKARTLLERLVGPGDRWHQLASHGEPLDLREFQSRLLREDELFLDYLLGPERSLLLVVTRTNCELHELAADGELGERTRLLRDLAAGRLAAAGGQVGPTTAAIAQGAKQLRRQLFGDAADLVSAARCLLISPDGVLNLLPWPLLLDDPIADDAPLSQRAWELVPSASFLVRLREHVSLSADRATTSPAPRILVLSGQRNATGAELAGARAEAESLERSYRGVQSNLNVFEPSREKPWSALNDYEIVHFATHSTVDDQAPWNSAIHLDPASLDAEPVALTARQIVELDLTNRLVVLASCQSVAGRTLSGEGIQGLTGAFLSAGVPAVVASLWPVDDAATAALMKQFYARLADGLAAPAALAAARHQLAANPLTAHPFYWAGFVFVGVGEAVPAPVRRPYVKLTVVIASLALGLGLALLFGRNFRRSTDH
jgi:tetratricopeptide (TPR) repeat protein